MKRLAYFTGIYPRATDTFIQREVTGLRELGFDVNTYSVRRSPAEHDVGPLVASEKARTRFLLPANPLALAAANLVWLFRHPGRYFRTLALCLRTSPAGWRSLLFQLFYFQEALLLASLLRRDRIDHLHNHLGDVSGTIALLASSLSDIPFSMTIHGPHIFFEPSRWALGEKVRAARFVVCISQFCRSQLMLQSSPDDWHKLAIVHCGVDISQFAFKAPEGEARSILYVGRLASEKGLPVLLEAFRRLAASHPMVRLRLVGDGPERQAMETLAVRLGIAERVDFLGYRDSAGVLRELQSVDAFVLPSFAEGVPVSLMEAMSCGVPVIGTNVGGVSELIANGRSGLLVPASDTDSLVEALHRLVSEPGLRTALANAGRQAIENEFRLEDCVAQLSRLFQDPSRTP